MPIYQEQQLQEVSKQFQIYGDILYAEPTKIGHINETYMATYNQGGTLVRYIHQKINQTVFQEPLAVMDNLVRVTTHLRRRLEAEGARDVTRKALTIVPARDGRSYFCNGAGDYWRTFVFVERAQTFESVQSPQQAYEAGRAFGRFQHLLVDLPGKRLVETIPHFHHTRRRYDALQKAVEADQYRRVTTASREIDFALKHEGMVDVLRKALDRGEIPERVAHNDTKFNNVMLDWETGEALCVLDLDTVMPGSVLYDFGDMVRTTTSPTLEDEKDLSKVVMQQPMFEALTHGYLDSVAPFLTEAEREYLVFAGRLITFTIGLRFLTDYLSGDKYFRIHRPEHNLDRCRTQFRLVESIDQQEAAMQRTVKNLWQHVAAEGGGALRKRKPAVPPTAKAKPGSRPSPRKSGRTRPAKG
ncbi:MAG: phosphotransferase [Verrucomicrobia bacterium]|nr:phosphotransferase [Verrucomicrobiota bacterium]